MTRPYDHRTPVLIVGGGITGLSTALFLARQGVRPTLVERHPSTALLPQARAFNPRSMEIYRALGLEGEIRGRTSMSADLPEMIGADTLTGRERFRIDLLAHVRPPATVSPTDWQMIDQDELERIVRAAAERGGADVRFGAELVSFAADADGVTAVVRDLGGDDEYQVRADYLVAADGHRAGVRNRLGIGADGPGVLFHAVHFVFDADLTAALRGRRFLLAYLDRPAMGTALVPTREFGRWSLGVPYRPETGESPDDFSEQRCAELARAAVGDPDLDLTLVPPVPGWPQLVSSSAIGGWVAHRYRAGRVFFAGDAAHVVPPSGSYGANTGIADAHNLAWKLAAVVKGRAGDPLLDTYDDERRPVAQVTLETAMRHLHDRHEGTGEDVTAIDDLTMTFGYRYDSAAVLTETPTPDGPVEDPRRPSGRPGLRAPHVWLDRAGTRLSTIDLFTGAFTVLIGPDGEEWATAARTAAASLDVELDVHHIGAKLHDVEDRLPDAYGITRTGATLVRPDGFVAWRAADLPQRPEHDIQRALTHLLAQDARHD
ncbi:putative polyketide hydroxylase [Thermomonospora echinospora]|uniref:Putative polyketide hydroxylase n=1 Tax=Thermomonospora echinospora TaxID=1992 RepID=A0A1H6DDS3_9ACTN|nr:FAD-dependent oxidoreductase [Thermomonospora echinospora]SEG82676.1 putative polyketide hydroxylase [Thermomonospora echinospora]